MWNPKLVYLLWFVVLSYVVVPTRAQELTLVPGLSGHAIVARPDLWGSVVEAYLARQVLPSEINQ
jgi:hypothetical protein